MRIASWNHIRMLYNLDFQNTTRLCPKLTASHIYPNPFAKMRVSFASQVLNNSVAAGIRTMVDLGQMHAPAEETATVFIEQMNQLFDFLNVKNKRAFVRVCY